MWNVGLLHSRMQHRSQIQIPGISPLPPLHHPMTMALAARQLAATVLTVSSRAPQNSQPAALLTALALLLPAWLMSYALHMRQISSRTAAGPTSRMIFSRDTISMCLILGLLPMDSPPRTGVHPALHLPTTMACRMHGACQRDDLPLLASMHQTLYDSAVQQRSRTKWTDALVACPSQELLSPMLAGV